MRRQGETTIANADLDELAHALTHTVADAAKAWSAMSEERVTLHPLASAVSALLMVERMGGAASR